MTTSPIYSAHAAYLTWLHSRGLPLRPYPGEALAARALEAWACAGDAPLFPGVVPWILQHLAGLHGCDMRCQWRVYSPTHHILVAREGRQKRLVAATNFGNRSDPITLAPAIYCALGADVRFDERPPRTAVLAIQYVATVGVGALAVAGRASMT